VKRSRGRKKEIGMVTTRVGLTGKRTWKRGDDVFSDPRKIKLELGKFISLLLPVYLFHKKIFTKLNKNTDLHTRNKYSIVEVYVSIRLKTSYWNRKGIVQSRKYSMR
jgi:hypothetical protein